jgi:hypothetical protein
MAIAGLWRCAVAGIKDGGTAFPVGPYEGMTLRDWLAGQALGLVPHLADNHGLSMSPKDMATNAYQIADAMLAARVKDGAR